MGSRLDIYNWPPVCISWDMKKRASGWMLQLLAFLREEIGGLQSRYLQSASCLPFEMDATTESK